MGGKISLPGAAESWHCPYINATGLYKHQLQLACGHESMSEVACFVYNCKMEQAAENVDEGMVQEKSYFSHLKCLHHFKPSCTLSKCLHNFF
jgi:hypothetical protein